MAAAGPALAQQAEPATHALADGRTYHALAPAPGAGEANRPLVLYLPSPAEPNLAAFAKDYWPLLRERNCVVAVPLSKSSKMWLAGEDQYVEQVLQDASKRYRTDPKRVVLLGVSGGGQLALFLADHGPEAFRAVIVVSANPVVIRGGESEWFYPHPSVLKTCPYLAINPLTEGSALMYWRQVAQKLNPQGASISVLPVLAGEDEHFPPPPKELGPWLDAVLAGKHPAVLEDPQQAAVAKMFAAPAAELAKALPDAAPLPADQTIVKSNRGMGLRVPLPKDFQRSADESRADSAGRPILQVRIEHRTDPIYVRCEARAANEPMGEVLAAEEQQTVLRGMLYQVYRRGELQAAGRRWDWRLGSITFPHRQRGWQSTLFFHASCPLGADGKSWLEVMVMDETQQPRAGQLAPIITGLLAGLKVGPPAPATQPATQGATEPARP